MFTSSSSSPKSFSSFAGACLLLLGASTARSAPADAPVAPDGSIAREGSPLSVPFGVDLVPLVGTSSALPRARRAVSLNLVGGLSGGLDVFELGGAFNLHSGEVRGLQLAGALNLVDGAVRGVQLAGGMNFAGDELAGLQLGPIDVAGADVEGAQLGAIAFAGGRVEGAQIGAIDVAGGKVEGVQVGAINVAGGGAEGVQVGAVNVAGGGVEGAQVGAVNIAGGKVDGLQLGAVNVASKAKAGVGVVNVYWDGWAESDFAVSETTLMLAGARHGSDREGIYNVYYAGTRLDRSSDLSLGIGIGGRWMLSSQVELSVDVTSISTALEGRFNRLHAQLALRPQIAWRIADTFALWAGPTLNVLTTEYEEAKLDLPSSAVRVGSSEDVQVWLWPGFAAGVRVF